MAARRRVGGQTDELLVELRKRLRRLPDGTGTGVSIEWVLAALVAAAAGARPAELAGLVGEAAKYLDLVAENEARGILEARRRNQKRQRLPKEFVERAHARLMRPRDEAQYLVRVARQALRMARAISERPGFRATPSRASNKGLCAEHVVGFLEIALRRCRGIRMGSKATEEPKTKATREVERLLGNVHPEHWSDRCAQPAVLAYLRAIGFARPDNLFRE